MAPTLELEIDAEPGRVAGKTDRILIAATIAVIGGRCPIPEFTTGTVHGPAFLKQSVPKTGYARMLALSAASPVRHSARRRNVRLRITLEDREYEVGVEILPEPDMAVVEEILATDIPESVLQPPRPPDTMAEDRVCRSPIPGLVTAVSVVPKQKVVQNDPLAVVEAMKMQNTIAAPLEGIVDQVLVKPGETVKAGQVLCTLS
jgi:biotin carboxyl carrier protein